MTLFFVLLFPMALLAADWRADVKQLMQDPDPVVKQRLSSERNLDEKLREALKKGGEDERLALEAIRRLQKTSLAPDLLQTLKSVPAEGMRGRIYFGTLAALAVSPTGKSIVPSLKEIVDPTDGKRPSSQRATMLNVLRLTGSVLPPSTLEKFLDDPSYELRTGALEMALENPSANEKFFHRALFVSPYTLRLSAAEAIRSFPNKKDFAVDLKKCASTDQNEEVRKACSL